jgi:DNA-binding response OmpR family regulator
MAARKTVMVIDDDPTIGQTVLRSLRAFDVDVVMLDRGFGALNAIAEHKPVLVIMDVMMPGLAGHDLTALLRKDKELSQTRVVLHSALDEDILARRTAECGADGYLLKTSGVAAAQRKLARWLS